MIRLPNNRSRWTVRVLSTWSPIAPGLYIRSQRDSHQMQLTAKSGNMVVDFYPVKFHTGEIHNRLILKVVTFFCKTQSKSYINKKDFDREVRIALRVMVIKSLMIRWSSVPTIPQWGWCWCCMFSPLLSSSTLFFMTPLTQTKSEFLVDSLIEVLNDRWKVDSIESGRHVIINLRQKLVGSISKLSNIWS